MRKNNLNKKVGGLSRKKTPKEVQVYFLGNGDTYPIRDCITTILANYGGQPDAEKSVTHENVPKDSFTISSKAKYDLEIGQYHQKVLVKNCSNLSSLAEDPTDDKTDKMDEETEKIMRDANKKIMDFAAKTHITWYKEGNNKTVSILVVKETNLDKILMDDNVLAWMKHSDNEEVPTWRAIMVVGENKTSIGNKIKRQKLTLEVEDEENKGRKKDKDTKKKGKEKDGDKGKEITTLNKLMKLADYQLFLQLVDKGKAIKHGDVVSLMNDYLLTEYLGFADEWKKENKKKTSFLGKLFNKKRGLDFCLEEGKALSATLVTTSGIKATVRLHPDGSLDTALVKLMFGLSASFYLKDLEGGTFLSVGGVRPGRSYEVHTSPLV
mmetsp:Transcript_25064/g.62994  ORF Transcript_25064/g.62994 Transcript_25064/m.62994 type:complete len:380 (-) Transcript_25064:75-1214(-)